MNKYITVYKTSFKQESKTFVNSITAVVSFIIIIYIFAQLWAYIYGGSGKGEIINGYTLNMMILYLIMGEIFCYAVPASAITREIGKDIKSGKIAYQLNKPYNYYGYQICNQVASSTWKLCFLLPSGVAIGVALLGGLPGFSVWAILPILLTIILSVILACALYTGIGLLSFWIEEATPFTWIVSKFLLFLGVFFPPEFFPGVMGSIITYSPIYAIIAGPSKLFANFSWELFGQVLGLQAGYTALFIIIGCLLYNKGTKKVNVHGG